MIWIICQYYYVFIFFNLIHLNACARPTFDTLFQVSDDKITDPLTGLPLSTETHEHKLNVTKEKIAKQVKAPPTTSSKYMDIDQVKSVILNTTAKVNQTSCIALNVIRSLQSVKCMNNSIEMTFDTAVNSAYVHQQWIERNVSFINGGKEWNCKNSTTGEPMIIMKKLIPNTFKLRKNIITVNITNDTNISPIVCFQSLTMHLMSEQENPNQENSTGTNTKKTMTTKSIKKESIGKASSNDFQSTSPAQDDTFTPGDTVRISWEQNGFDSSYNKNFQVKLKRHRPLWPDAEIQTATSCTDITSGVCFDTIPSNDALSADFYYEFSWCGWWPFSCTIDGPYFQIPAHRVGGWNYNSYYDRAASQKQIFYMDCSSSSSSFVSRLCGEGRQMSIDVRCANCYLKYDYSIFRLDLIASGGQLGKMNVTLVSTTTVNLELLIIFNYIYTKSGAISLGKHPIYGFSFSVFSISFDLGFILEIELPYKIELDALGQVSAGLRYTLDTSIHMVSYGSRQDPIVSWSLDKYYYPIEAGLKAKLTIDIGLKPTLRISAVVFSAGITTEGFLNFQNEFQYPPFSALTTYDYDYDLSNPSLFHFSYPSDACISQHFLQYHIQFGLRNTLLIFDITLGPVNSIIQYFADTHYEKPLMSDYVWELLSGCLFKSSRMDSPQPINLYLDIPLDTSSSFLDYFKPSVTFDLGNVLKVDPTRVLLNGVQSYLDQKSRKSVTKVIASLLPSVKSLASDPTVQTLTQTLVSQEVNPSSFLYTSTKWLKLLMKDLTLPSNNTGISTTTATTMPSGTTQSTTQNPASACPSGIMKYDTLVELHNATAFDFTHYEHLYRAVSNRTTLLFAFFHYASRWALDDISVTRLNATNNLIVNGGFETGTLTPFSLCRASTSSSARTLPFGSGKTGNYYFVDDNKQPYDILWQTFTTIPQQEYVIAYSLQNFGPAPNTFFAYLGALNTTGQTRLASTNIEQQIPRQTMLIATDTQAPVTKSSSLSCPTGVIKYEYLFYLYNATAFNYTRYEQTYRALSDRTTLFFAFVHYKSQWALDDISVTRLNTTNNLIINSGFETGTLAPFSVCPPSSTYSAGTVHWGDSKTGNYSFVDSSYKPYDFLWQTFTTVPLQEYVITYSLRNFGPAPNLFVAFLAALNTTAQTTSAPTTTQQLTTNDISVTKLNTTENLIINGGFETGELSPFLYCAKSMTESSGTVYRGYAQTGLFSYRDGSTITGNYIWQEFATVPLVQYVITFSLRNLGPAPNAAYVTFSSLNTTGQTTSAPITTLRQTTSLTTTTRRTNISATISLCPDPPLIANRTVTLLSRANSSEFNYTYFRYTYRAISNLTTLTFAFYHDPSYWCLDDISVTRINSSANLIANGGFETGSASSYSVCEPTGASPAGYVFNECPHTGLHSFYDGSYLPGDYLSQTFTTQIGTDYEISFWLRNLGSIPNSVKVTVTGNVISSYSTTRQTTTPATTTLLPTPITISKCQTVPKNSTTVLLLKIHLHLIIHEPSYWCLDDITVKLNNTNTNILVNGGFETGVLNGYSICNQNSSTFSGGISPNQCAHSGQYGFYDGSYANFDYLWQVLTTIAGKYYEINFWLLNLGLKPNSFKATIGPYIVSDESTTTTHATTTRVSTTTQSTTHSCPPSLQNATRLLSIVNAAPFNYTYYSYTYVAKFSRTTLIFAFQHEPAWWCLDDISVRMNNSDEYIVDGSFESGLLSSYSLCNPWDSSSSGEIATQCIKTGSYSYLDGSYPKSDYLSQIFSTQPHYVYKISFWLRNLGSKSNSMNVTIY
ncbi:unnamed protein product [Rotaria sp. Silwood1]|nr:unnamed protein product [Rotaria sp. Silwood1]